MPVGSSMFIGDSVLCKVKNNIKIFTIKHCPLFYEWQSVKSAC